MKETSVTNLNDPTTGGKAAHIATLMELQRRIAGMMPGEDEPDAQYHFFDQRRPWDGRLYTARRFISQDETTTKQARTIVKKAVADIERDIDAYEKSKARIVSKAVRKRQKRQEWIEAKPEREADREAVRQRAIDAFPELAGRDDFIVIGNPKIVDLEAEGGQASPLVFWPQADWPSAGTNGKAEGYNDTTRMIRDGKAEYLWQAPHDFWSGQPKETIGPGMLPTIIENVAFETAARRGFDRDALAMSMLTMLSSVISTNIEVWNSSDPDETFAESIRVWLALVGVAGSGKSPMLKMIQRPFQEIDRKLSEQYYKDKAAYDALSKDEQKETDKPKHEQLILPDASTEAAQVAFSDNEQGMLLLYDELVSFFGAKSRYGKGGGEQSSLGFWLSVYDSSRFKSKRLSRADVDCNPSGSIIGGIQPKMLDSLMDEDANNAGLVQRYNPVMMPESAPAPIESDEPAKYPMNLYWQLVNDIYYRCPLRLTGAALHFARDAEPIKKRFSEWVRETVAYYRPIDDALASHINKFPGMFLRFCGLFHTIDNWDAKQPRLITKETASKVYRFMTVPRLAHAVAFYNKLKENEQNADMRGVAEYILQHELEAVSARDIQQGTARFRRISTRDIAEIVGNMVSLGWLNHILKRRSGGIDPLNWDVNPEVHEAFAHRVPMIREKAAKAKATAEKIASEGGRRKNGAT